MHSGVVIALDSVVCLPLGDLFRVMEKKIRHFVSPLDTFKEEYETFNRTLKGCYWLYLHLEFKAFAYFFITINWYTRKGWWDGNIKRKKKTHCSIDKTKTKPKHVLIKIVAM